MAVFYSAAQRTDAIYLKRKQMTQRITHIPANRSDIVPVAPGQTIAFGFELSGVSFERGGADLLLSFDGGGRMTLQNFFVAGSESGLPDIELEDGRVVDGGDFLRNIDAAFNISTAAGPSAVRLGSGLGEYDSNAGTLISGVDRLDSLGTDQWGPDTGTEFIAPAVFASDGAAATPVTDATPPVTPPITPPITPPTTPSDAYHTRVIVNASQNGAVRVAAFDADGNSVFNPASIGSCRFENAEYFNPPAVDPLTGELVFTLTEAGLRALEAGARFEDILYVTVNGKEYPMHVVGNSGRDDYNVTETESASGMPGPLHAEWYSHESGDMLDGKTVTLGGGQYNEASVIVNAPTGAASGMGNSHIALAEGVEGKVRVAAGTDDGSAYAVRVGAFAGNADSTIDAGSQGDVFIEARSGNATAMGLVTQSGANANGALYESTADVRGRNISFTTDASEKTAAGIWASGNSEVTIRADGDVRFFSTATGGTVNYLAVGAYAADSATVNISGANVSADSKALQGGGADGSVISTGFRATTGTEMNITTADSGLFSVSTFQESSPYSSPYSGVSWSGGRAAGFTSVGVSASGNVNQWGQGTRSALNVNAGDVAIASSVNGASDKGTATGIYAGYGGDVTINTSELDNTLIIRGDAPSWGVGVFSTNNGTTTINTGKGDDALRIGGSAHNGAAAIGLAAQAGGKTVIDGGTGRDTLHIETSFTGDRTLTTDYMDTTGGAFGMNSAWGYASNVISNVENVTITADASGSATGWAYGMFTRDGWGHTVKNIIENTDSPLTVVITAKAGAAGQAYAMYGVAGGHNLIQGGSREEDLHGDSVILNGNVGGWNNLNEVRTGAGNDAVELNGSLTGGSNVFSMGGGADRFTLNGNVTGGGNSIDMGAGNDLVIVNGQVSGVLKIIGGDGYDTLVLQADSFADFTARYDAWLTGSLGDIQVENIHVNINGLNDDDRTALESYFNDNRFGGYDVDFSSGDAPFAGVAATNAHEAVLLISDLLDTDHEEIDINLPGLVDEDPDAAGVSQIPNGLSLHGDTQDANAPENGNAPGARSSAPDTHADLQHGQETDTLLAQQEILSGFGG